MIINIKIRWIFFYNEHTSAIIGLNIFSYFKQRTRSHITAHHFDVNKCLLHNLIIIIFFLKNISISQSYSQPNLVISKHFWEVNGNIYIFANINQDKGRGDGHYLEKRLHRWFKYISMDWFNHKNWKTY